MRRPRGPHGSHRPPTRTVRGARKARGGRIAPARSLAVSIRVLGCSGAIAAGCRTTAFLVDESVLIDAGTGVGDLSIEEMARIDHICVSHSHLDHIVSIPLLADTVLRQRMVAGRGPIVVHALPETIEALRRHVFNGIIWPDFTRLPSAEAPVMCFEPFRIGERFSVAGREIEVLPAAHTVPAVGFAVRGRLGDWVFSGDTGANEALWARLAQLPVIHLVIETAFSDDESELARISGHLAPSGLVNELRSLARAVTVHITHIKPGEDGAVMSELGRMSSRHRPEQLRVGQVLHID